MIAEFALALRLGFFFNLTMFLNMLPKPIVNRTVVLVNYFRTVV